MKYCEHCGAQIDDDAFVCIKCGCRCGRGPRRVEPENPNESLGLYKALGFFIPIVGLIMFLIWNDEKPIRAKATGKYALIGFIIHAVLGIALAIASYILLFTYGKSLFEYIMDLANRIPVPMP